MISPTVQAIQVKSKKKKKMRRVKMTMKIEKTGIIYMKNEDENSFGLNV